MRILLSAVVLWGLVLFGVEGSGQSTYSAIVEELLRWGEYVGILAVGWGTGIFGWLGTAHWAGSLLLSKMPRAWRLYRQGVLTSQIPFFKYLGGGLLLLVLGALGGRELPDLWTETFDTGLWVGAACGLLWSIKNFPFRTKMVDFLLSNKRYVDKRKVSLFENDDE